MSNMTLHLVCDMSPHYAHNMDNKIKGLYLGDKGQKNDKDGGREICMQPAAAASGTQEEGRVGGEKVTKPQLCLQAMGQALGYNRH